MTNLPIKSTLANLQVFYKNFPMQSHASINLPKKSIIYKVPDIFLDTVAHSAEMLIAKLQLPMKVIKTDVFSNIFIVKEVKGGE